MPPGRMNLGIGKKLLKLLRSNILKPAIGHYETVINNQRLTAF
jgi:hypothetical protein